MKGTLNNLNIALFGLYMVGIVLIVFSLISLPVALERASIKIDEQVMQQVMPVLKWRFVAVGGTLLAGIGTLLLTIRLAGQQREEGCTDHGIEAGDGTEERKEIQSGAQVDGDQHLRSIELALSAAEDPKQKADKWLSAICQKMEASQGVLYVASEDKSFELYSAFAFDASESGRLRYAPGEGLVGQSGLCGKSVVIHDIPPNYITVFSGLGSAEPATLLVMPLKIGRDVMAVVEIASFLDIANDHMHWIETAFPLIHPVLPVAKRPEVKGNKGSRNKNSRVATR